MLVNDVLSNGGTVEAPFGGIKQSGFGRAMGDDALREMCDQRHISVDRFLVGDSDPLWFPYTEKSYGWYEEGDAGDVRRRRDHEEDRRAVLRRAPRG